MTNTKMVLIRAWYRKHARQWIASKWRQLPTLVFIRHKTAVIFEVNKRQRGLVLTTLKIDCFVDFTDGLSVHLADEAIEDADTLAVRSPRACHLLTLR